MPSFRHGKATAVLFDGHDLSAYLNEATVSSSMDTSESTTFGSNSKTYVVALKDGTISLSGLFESSTTGSDPVVEAALTATSDNVMTIAPEGNVIGRRAWMAAAKETTYEISAPVADIVSITVDAQVDGGIDSGVLLAGAEAITTATTTNGTNIDNAASTDNGGVAHLNVTANTRDGATTFKVQHSSDNSTWVDLATFTSVSATTTEAQRVEVASGTTVQRHLRAQAVTTGSAGSITYTVSFARR